MRVTVESKGADEFELVVDDQRFPMDRNDVHNLVAVINDALRFSLVLVPRLR